MRKWILLTMCFLFPLSLFANDTEIFEQGSSSYYYSAIDDKDSLTNYDPLISMLHENLIAGFTRAAIKCYFKQLDPKVRCPDFAIGHATMKAGIPRSKICTAAKR